MQYKTLSNQRLGFVLFLAVVGLFLIIVGGRPNQIQLSGFGLPIQIMIPKIGVNTTVESVGLTPEGAMDAPKSPTTTAWFNGGPRPGQVGSAVIDGHFGWKDGELAVFDQLGKLKKGDFIYIKNENGVTVQFMVREVRIFDEEADASEVFFSTDGLAHLNLITCGGEWNKGTESYSTRTVVFADAVQDEQLGWKIPRSALQSFESNLGQLAYSSIRASSSTPQGLPVRFQVPIIGVDALIEDALITPEGRMDVPVGSANVAWFALGPRPGQVGSAVIGGHYGVSDGVPWVFYNLNKLKIGDKVSVVNDKGETLNFIVRKIKTFERTDSAAEVFVSKDGIAHLNIITCDGVWNRVNDSYPQRLVIFTDRI